MAYIGRTPTNAALTAADLADGIVSADKIASNAVTTAKINGDAVTDAKIADDVVGTEHLTANEVDTAALGADAVTGAQLADDAVNSEHYTDGSIDTAHLADGQVTTAKLATAVFTAATDIGAAIVDADLFLMDDGAGGTIRKTAASRIKTYAGGLTGVSTDSGNVTITDGNLTFGGAGHGVHLGVTSATASNLLNDYEFGTWTPAVSGSPSGSYSFQYGNYTKINKMVYITGNFQANLSGGSGSAKITGLPFTPDSGSNVYYEPVTLGFTYGLGESLYQGFFQADATEFFLLKEPSSGARTHVNTSDIVSGDCRISFSGFYNTAS